MTWENFYEMVFYTRESLWILLITAITCGVIGAFLLFQKLSMVADAISHSVLLGIVLAFFITKDINSPWLIVAAALFGVLTVFFIESLSKTGLVHSHDSVGIIFPLLFSLAVILITKYARNVHLDTDMVLMGEVIMAPLNRIQIGSISLPKSLVQMGILLPVNLLFIGIFFKELKVTTFDKEFATLAGFSSALLFYALMTLASLTAVTAFDAVGAILVVSFLITPSASAFLVTKDLKKMLWISALYAAINVVLGYVFSLIFQVSMSGMTATVAGLTFFLTFLFHHQGLVTSLIKRRQRKTRFRGEMMLMHVGNHTGEANEAQELGLTTIKDHLLWSQAECDKQSEHLIKQGLLKKDFSQGIFRLTDDGQKYYDKIKQEYGM